MDDEELEPPPIEKAISEVEISPETSTGEILAQARSLIDHYDHKYLGDPHAQQTHQILLTGIAARRVRDSHIQSRRTTDEVLGVPAWALSIATIERLFDISISDIDSDKAGLKSSFENGDSLTYKFFKDATKLSEEDFEELLAKGIAYKYRLFVEEDNFQPRPDVVIKLDALLRDTSDLSFIKLCEKYSMLSPKSLQQEIDSDLFIEYADSSIYWENRELSRSADLLGHRIPIRASNRIRTWISWQVSEIEISRQPKMIDLRTAFVLGAVATSEQNIHQ